MVMNNMNIFPNTIIYLLLPVIYGASNFEEEGLLHLMKGTLFKPDSVSNSSIGDSIFSGEPVKFQCHFGDET